MPNGDYWRIAEGMGFAGPAPGQRQPPTAPRPTPAPMPPKPPTAPMQPVIPPRGWRSPKEWLERDQPPQPFNPDQWLIDLFGGGEGGIPPMPPREEWPPGLQPRWDPTTMQYVWQAITGFPEEPEEVPPGMETPLPGGAQPGETITLPDGSTGFWTRGPYGYPKWNQLTSPTPLPPTAPSPWERGFEEEQFDWLQQFQQQQLEQQQQNYLARLMAQPRSWLEYAAAAGETPAIQKWMLPLMPQQYSQLGAGAAIPGWQGTEGGGAMPQLLTPSRQYQARMGPTAMQQYQGYQQTQTGATPEETQWRLWSGAPPGGTYRGLTQAR